MRFRGGLLGIGQKIYEHLFELPPAIPSPFARFGANMTSKLDSDCVAFGHPEF